MISAQFLNQAILALHTPISIVTQQQLHLDSGVVKGESRGLLDTRADELSVRSNDVIRCIPSGT